MNVSSAELCANNLSLDSNTLDTYIGGYFTTDYLEIAIYILCLAIGGPLNVYAFANSMNALVNHGTARFNRLLILRINLNIADLLTMFVYTLTQIVWMSTFQVSRFITARHFRASTPRRLFQWYGGDFLCRLCKFFYTFSFYLNSFIVVSIALDRLYTTYHLNEFKAAAALKNVRIMISIAWVAATLLSLPQMYIFRVFVFEESHFEQCAPIWTIYHYYIQQNTEYNIPVSDEIIADATRVMEWERLYNWLHLLTIFWIPALIIVASYVGILTRLQKNISGNGSTKRGGSIRSLRPSSQQDRNGNSLYTAVRSNSVDYGISLCAYTDG